jgi:hypothetical protein
MAAPTALPLKVAVVTSARTYSAGFGLAAMLYRHGATVVGVPSAQAGNCTIDSLSFRLQNSGLSGTISYKKSVRFPDDPLTGRELTPDRALRYRQLAAADFDPHQVLRLAQSALNGVRDRKLQGAPAWRWRGKADGALALLAERYRLAEIAGAAKTNNSRERASELRRLWRLRDWVHGRWAHHSTNRPRRSDALSILADAERGQRYRCVEYSIVLAQVYRAQGYCARLLRLQGRGAHVLTEVYAPGLRKWVLVDGQFAAHVTRGGAPLSTLEVVRALRKDKGKGLTAWVGGRREPRYLAWLASYTELLMAPVDMSYGHELDQLAVLLRAKAKPPQTKPPYLRQASYLYLRDGAAFYPRCPTIAAANR